MDLWRKRAEGNWWALRYMRMQMQTVTVETKQYHHQQIDISTLPRNAIPFPVATFYLLFISPWPPTATSASSFPLSSPFALSHLFTTLQHKHTLFSSLFLFILLVAFWSSFSTFACSWRKKSSVVDRLTLSRTKSDPLSAYRVASLTTAWSRGSFGVPRFKASPAPLPPISRTWWRRSAATSSPRSAATAAATPPTSTTTRSVTPWTSMTTRVTRGPSMTSGVSRRGCRRRRRRLPPQRLQPLSWSKNVTADLKTWKWFFVFLWRCNAGAATVGVPDQNENAASCGVLKWIFFVFFFLFLSPLCCT